MIEVEEKIPERKKSRVIWVLIVVSLLILVGAFAAYYYTSQQLVPVLRVTVDVGGNSSVTVINTIEYFMEETPKTEDMGETTSHLPGVYLMAMGLRSGTYFQPYTEWTSTDFTGNGKYTLTASFKFQPDKGELLKIQVRINDGQGESIARSEFVIHWNYEFFFNADCTVENTESGVEITNASIRKGWEDPSKISQGKVNNIPGVYFTVENEFSQLNNISSVAYTGTGKYTVTSYFMKPPMIGEILKMNLFILDSQNNKIAEYPKNGNWTISFI